MKVLGRDEAGVSAVVGGLLFMTIVIITLVNFRVAIVPMIDEQREATHMSLVGDRFASIKGDADRQVDGRSRSPVSNSVPLKPAAKSTLLTDGTLSSYLSFTPGGRTVSLDTNELKIQVDNGTTIFGPEETWTNITTSNGVENITEVRHLRVRVEDPADQNTGEYILITVYDAGGYFGGDLRIYIDTHPSGYSVNTRVRDAEYDILYDQGESFFSQDQPEFYWVDALADEVQFSDVLGASTPPFSMTFQRGGMDGAFTIVYYEETTVGSILVGGVGKRYPDWNRTEVGGVLTYESQNVRFLRQDLFLESGGIIVDQPVGDTFYVEPAFDVGESGNWTVLRVTVPALTGRAETHSGRDPVPVRVQGTTESTTLGTAPRLGMNVTTQHPKVWLTFWEWKFEAAGYTESAGHFTLTNGTDWARFVFYGRIVDPNSLEHDLALEIHTGQVEVVMRG